ncbi:MAG: methyltransferase domain-containing protein [Chloroflexi bacterium]|nr:methyltransferase domain-containing protein [Chloroflexota bacterium]
MATQSFDPQRFKLQQREEYDSSAAGWKNWWYIFERDAQLVSDRLVELAGVDAGHRVLDLATGTGEPAVTVARRVGPRGHVVATDLSPQMLAIAQERAATLGLQNIECHVMDAETLELAGQTFDSVVCRWGLMFLPDLSPALRRMHKLLVKGGRVVAAVWGAADRVPLLSLPRRVIQEQLRLAGPPPVHGAFSLADPALLKQAFSAAGYSDVRTEQGQVTFSFTSAEDYSYFVRDIGGRLRAMLADQPAGREAAVWRSVADAARGYAASDGSLALRNEVIYVIARK